MPFEAFLDNDDSAPQKNAKVLFPISLGQKYHTGERLKALMQFAKDYNATFLIADALHQHNLGDLQKALHTGAKFLEKNEDVFRDTVLIKSVEDWEKYKEDATVIKVIRWQTWGIIKQDELKKASLLIETACHLDGSTLVKAMKDTAQSHFSKQNVENSVKYQTEENTYLLSFSEFDYHIYPAPLNTSQAETYRLFRKQSKMPIHKQVKFRSLEKAEHFAAKKQQRHEQSLPLALRVLTSNIEEFLHSTEIAPKHKALFISKLQSILISTQHQYEIEIEPNKPASPKIPSKRTGEFAEETTLIFHTSSLFAHKIGGDKDVPQTTLQTDRLASYSTSEKLMTVFFENADLELKKPNAFIVAAQPSSLSFKNSEERS